MVYNIEVNYSDDSHMKSGIFYAVFNDTIWNLIPVLHCPFKGIGKVKIYPLKNLDLHLHTFIVITYIYLNI